MLKEIFIESWLSLGIEGVWIFLILVFLSLSLSQLGVLMLLNRSVLMGDVLSHSVLPGIILAFLLIGSLSSSWLLFGAFISAFLAMLFIRSIQKYFQLKEDVAMVIVFTSFFALGVLLSVRYGSRVDLDPSCILYGNLEHSLQSRIPFGKNLMMPAILPRIFLIFLSTFSLLVVFQRILFSFSFDFSFANTCRFFPQVAHFLLMSLLVFTIVDGFRIVGVALIVSLLVLPSAFAFLCVHKWKKLFLVASLHSIFSCYLGVGFAYYFNCNTSSAVVLAGFFLFLLAWFFHPANGLFKQFANLVSRNIHLFRLSRRSE